MQELPAETMQLRLLTAQCVDQAQQSMPVQSITSLFYLPTPTVFQRGVVFSVPCVSWYVSMSVILYTQNGSRYFNQTYASVVVSLRRVNCLSAEPGTQVCSA